MAKTTRDLVRLAVLAAEGHKAQELLTLDVRGRSSVTDYFLIASGTSDTHVRAIADAVREKLAEAGQRPLSFEGYEDGTWVLLDFVDFVVHVFHYEKRIYFGLEELWSDAKRVAFRTAPKGAAPKVPAARRAAAVKKAPAAKKAAAARKSPVAKKTPARKSPTSPGSAAKGAARKPPGGASAATGRTRTARKKG